MEELPRRTHREVLEQVLELAGARVADIGCGEGALVRLMTRLGARATGIEPSEGQLGRARAAEPAGEEDYLQGLAEALPLPDASLDIAVFFNALHHVPVEHQDAALAEAARALKPGGLLYVVEPLAEGQRFEVTRRIEDETEVRAKAYAALMAAAQGPDWNAEREYAYLTETRDKSFEAFRDRIIAVDETRRRKVEAEEANLRAAFEAAASKRDGDFVLEQPARLNLLRRR
jgi:ubiquinone/menaquinone biosynthesis C-methylase UbiE